MNELTAQKQGFQFQGCYSHNREEVAARANEFKKLGYKVIVANTPPDKLSRGHHGMGYSLMIEPKYFIDKKIQEVERNIMSVEVRKFNAKIEYEKLLRSIDDSHQNSLKLLEELKAEKAKMEDK